jgi:ribulose bisphosphate carboxylase small subunit
LSLKNDGNQNVDYARLRTIARDITSGSEDGAKVIDVLVNGAVHEFFRLDGSTSEAVINQAGADIDFRVEGDTVTDLLLVDAGNDRVNVNGTLRFPGLTGTPTFASHASRHKDGGADELDVADLAGGDGTAGQYIRTDGADAGWSTITASDISDVSADSVSGAHHTKYTDEEAQDAVGTITSGGDKITVTYDDANNTITIDTSALDAEEVQDEVNTVLAGGDKISTSYDDANDTLTINTTALDAEEVEDQVDSLLQGGTNISLTYDDAANTLTIDGTGTTRSDEEIEDVVNALLTGGTNVSLTYDDANDELTIDATQKTTEEVQDDVGGMVLDPLQYNDANNEIGIDINGLTSATVASDDVLHIEDNSDNNNPKKVTAQDVADLNSNKQHRNEILAFGF